MEKQVDTDLIHQLADAAQIADDWIEIRDIRRRRAQRAGVHVGLIEAAAPTPSIQRLGMSLMTCEVHPWQEWPHDDCSGPGMPITASLEVLRNLLDPPVRSVALSGDYDMKAPRKTVGG